MVDLVLSLEFHKKWGPRRSKSLKLKVKDGAPRASLGQLGDPEGPYADKDESAFSYPLPLMAVTSHHEEERQDLPWDGVGEGSPGSGGVRSTGNPFMLALAHWSRKGWAPPSMNLTLDTVQGNSC